MASRWSLDLAKASRWLEAAQRAWWRAWEWWLAALLEPLPDRWRERLLGGRGRLLLELRAGGWLATWTTGLAPRRSTSTVELTNESTFEAARAALGAPPGARATLLLGDDDCLQRRLYLPAAAGAVLKEVLRNEVARLTPMPRGDLAVQHRVVRRDVPRKRVLVDVFVARVSVISGLVASWSRAGWSLEAIAVRHDGEIDRSVDFLAASSSAARRFGVALPHWSLLAVAAAAVVALYGPTWRYQALIAAHDKSLTELRAAALAARDTLTQRDRLVARGEFMAAQRAGRVPTLAALAELTQIVPDDSWLYQLHIAGEHIQVQGESASASAVAQALESSALLAGAEFTAPISTVPGDGRERFVIDAELRGRAMKQGTDKRAQIGLAYAVLIAVVALVASATVGPAISARGDFYRGLAADRESYARFDAAIAAAERVSAENGASEADVDRAQFLAGDTDVLAAAELQSRLKALADERHGSVASMSLEPVQSDGVFPSVAVTVSLQCSIDGLLDLLYAIETGAPALFVEELSVQSLHQTGRVLPTRDVELEVRVKVKGYRYVEPGAPREQS